MGTIRCALVTLLGVLALGCAADSVNSPTEPSAARERQLSRPNPAQNGFTHIATGGYHFLIPADFNGGIFGGAVDNRLTFTAMRDADGNVSGSFNYEQTDFGTAGIPYTYKGLVTCFKVYDTPVLQNFPDIPAMTGNRAKWGGVIEETNDPGVPVGTFGWFQSIDNGEGSNSPADLSTLFGLGDEAANEAFCNSENVPNPNFGPHAVQGNIQVR
jgi:hypothetical protein